MSSSVVVIKVKSKLNYKQFKKFYPLYGKDRNFCRMFDAR